MKVKPKKLERKKSPSPHEITICLLEHLVPVKKQNKRTAELLSQPRTPPAPLATTSPPILSD